MNAQDWKTSGQISSVLTCWSVRRRSIKILLRLLLQQVDRRTRLPIKKSNPRIEGFKCNLSNILFELRPKLERVVMNIFHVDAGIVVRGEAGRVPRTSGRQLGLLQQRHLTDPTKIKNFSVCDQCTAVTEINKTTFVACRMLASAALTIRNWEWCLLWAFLLWQDGKRDWFQRIRLQ